MLYLFYYFNSIGCQSYRKQSHFPASWICGHSTLLSEQNTQQTPMHYNAHRCGFCATRLHDWSLVQPHEAIFISCYPSWSNDVYQVKNFANSCPMFSLQLLVSLQTTCLIQLFMFYINPIYQPEYQCESCNNSNGKRKP